MLQPIVNIILDRLLKENYISAESSNFIQLLFHRLLKKKEGIKQCISY